MKSRLISALLLCAGPAGFLGAIPTFAQSSSSQPAISSRSISVIQVGALRFRDLNRSGALDPYEDWRLSPEDRARDLIQRMTLAEKAGAMMHGTAPFPGGGMRGESYDRSAARTLILERYVTSLITRLAVQPRNFAEEARLVAG